MMDKKQTMACSKDLVGKAKKIQGKELDEFMSQYFARTWEHFDVNNDQLLDAADMPGFQKYLLSEQGIDLDALYWECWWITNALVVNNRSTSKS